MNWKIIAIGFVLVCAQAVSAGSKLLVNRQYGFSLRIPAACTEITDTLQNPGTELYFDTTAGVILMISERQSQFATVDQYISCGNDSLESMLRTDFGDTALTLVSCIHPAKYTRQTTVLYFTVSVLPMGFDSYIIYFIHHNDKDIQFSFTFKKSRASESMAYINKVIGTLKLK